MKDTTNLTLINGQFTAQDAHEILTALFRNKINYHEIQLFGDSIRFGKDMNKSEKRIAELKADTKKMKEFMAMAIKNNFEVEIHSEIVIKVKQPEVAAV